MNMAELQRFKDEVAAELKSVTVPDELTCQVVEWFHKHIEDGMYSEALYELMSILDENELVLWERIIEAEKACEIAEDEREKAQEQVSEIEKLLEELGTE